MPNYNSYIQFKGSNPFGSQAKMLFHLDRLAEYVNCGTTNPIFVEFNLTDRCNLACKWCISENCRSNATISPYVAKRFLTDFKKMGGKAVTFSGGGEPTYHPSFETIAQHALSLRLDVGLMTNGVYPSYYNSTIQHFNWVRFSVDTLDPRKYKAWKGKDRLHEVLHNLAELRNTAVKTGINVNVSGEHTVEDIQKLLEQQGLADYIQFRPVLPRYYKEDPIELNDAVWQFLRRYYSDKPNINLSLDKLNDLEQERFFEFDSCEGHVFNPIVHANGDVAVCMYHPGDERFIFGNLNNDDFFTIWKSRRREEVMDKLREINYCEECQVCCKLTELNKLLQYINTPQDDMDINFL